MNNVKVDDNVEILLSNLIEKWENLKTNFAENNLQEQYLAFINECEYGVNNIANIIKESELELINNDIKSSFNNQLANLNNNFDTIIATYDINNNIPQIDILINSIKESFKNLNDLLINFINFTLIFGNVNSIRNNIKTYKRELTLTLNSINDDFEKNKNEINEKKQNIINETDSITNKIEELNIKLREIENKQNLDTENFKNNLDDDIEKSNATLEEIKSKYENQLTNTQNEYLVKFNSLAEEYKKKFDDLHSEILSKDEKISDLIGIVGNKSKIGEYKSNADYARKSRVFWQRATVGLFAASFTLMIIFTIFTNSYDKMIIIRYAVTALLLAAAGYTAKQAGNQRKDEIYFRKQQLELSSIDVYLENLPDEKRQEIKSELALKIFGQARESYNNKYDDSASTAFNAIENLLDKYIKSK